MLISLPMPDKVEVCPQVQGQGRKEEEKQL